MENEPSSVIIIILILAYLAFWALFVGAIVAGLWKTFSKAGQPGWAALIPGYNLYVMTQVSGSGIMWFVLSLVPCVNIIATCKIHHDIAKSFGRDIGTTIGLILLPFVFWPILGFGKAEYEGPAGGNP